MICVMKNLRVCKDCYKVMKFVFEIYKRDIVMRDRIRFYCFRDGKCICGDYWWNINFYWLRKMDIFNDMIIES